MRRARGRRAREAVGVWAVVLLSACASAGPSTHGLLATLWVRSSAEYRGLAEQAYRAASQALSDALADAGASAALEQGSGQERLPPAVILDVDETVLDNSAFEAGLLAAGRRFTTAAWNAWVDSAVAPPVPGALGFAGEARRAGVTLFYVTNRTAAQETATRRNLSRHGFPLDDELDTVLMQGEREGWSADKTSRREFVARRFRVLLLVGDDLNDFVPARRPPAERRRLAATHSGRWGRSWILVPNPIYGSWSDAVLGFDSDLTEEERRRRRLEALASLEDEDATPLPEEGS